MLSRHLKTINQGDVTLYRVLIESEDCEWGTQHCKYVQFELLGYIANDPSVSACGYSEFKKLTMLHNGTKWIVEAEATVKS
jgi:hypothetical protein